MCRAVRQQESQRRQGCAGDGSLDVEETKLVIGGVCQAPRHESLRGVKPRRWNSAPRLNCISCERLVAL